MRNSLSVAILVGLAAIGAALLLGDAWGLGPSWSDVLPASVIMLAAFAVWWRVSRRQQRH